MRGVLYTTLEYQRTSLTPNPSRGHLCARACIVPTTAVGLHDLVHGVVHSCKMVRSPTSVEGRSNGVNSTVLDPTARAVCVPATAMRFAQRWLSAGRTEAARSPWRRRTVSARGTGVKHDHHPSIDPRRCTAQTSPAGLCAAWHDSWLWGVLLEVNFRVVLAVDVGKKERRAAV